MLEANKLFDEVLARRDRADATRNALGVLQRFKFLFSLPVSIERNIRKGDYDVVINDYARARNLFSKTDVAVSISSSFSYFSSYTSVRVKFERKVHPCLSLHSGNHIISFHVLPLPPLCPSRSFFLSFMMFLVFLLVFAV
jgi:hypothetical protein